VRVWVIVLGQLSLSLTIAITWPQNPAAAFARGLILGLSIWWIWVESEKEERGAGREERLGE
jgi:hypothetical protein